MTTYRRGYVDGLQDGQASVISGRRVRRAMPRESGWEVSFSIHARVGSELRKRLVDVVVRALTGVDDDGVSDEGLAAEAGLVRGALAVGSADLRITHEQFARFFVHRRAAGLEAIQNIRWERAEQVYPSS